MTLNHFMRYLLIYIVTLIACGCKGKTQHIGREPNIQFLIDQIDNSDCVYFGGVGLAGENSKIYDCYRTLLKISPDSMWVNLSFNRNQIIRVYAFEALKKIKSLHLQEVRDRLKKDKATFCYVSDDVKAFFSVCDYVAGSK